MSDLTGVTLIVAGANHNFALVGGPGKGGVVMAWGCNATGQLGDGSTTNRSTPVKTQDAWSGEDASGQLGEGTTDQRNTPVPVLGLTDVQLVAGGREHTLALLGDGTTIDNSTPVTTLTTLTSVDKIAAAIGGDFSLAN